MLCYTVRYNSENKLLRGDSVMNVNPQLMVYEA